ncbi:RagB/SusD family nutrient uptake outer membrane protein [Sphingobacterium lumbrici]|uniref:RagB/SusD family nutrient uptake outer membrane protein n=1 Tax=Sphingobacterium lumbrici TaxID=2559600 RepID=UPI00112BDC88|nr:RagB/SusD family nutrient uptake outer membrane protein [Sphingobacterium lumbrici]
MNSKLYMYRLSIPMMVALLATSCMKEFLDIKRDKSQVVPDRIEDLEAILLHSNMNSFTSHQLGETGADDYFVSDAQWQTISNPSSKNGYIWADDVFSGMTSQDWNRGYEKILYANFVMDGLQKLVENNRDSDSSIDRVRGMAHFYRGTNYFFLAQLFAPQYVEDAASQMQGLPLRTTSNINIEVPRSNLLHTYELIESDLKKASVLLPKNTQFKTIPNSTAAYAMLAILKLQRGEYEEGKKYADTALFSAPPLLNFNEVNYDAAVPFPSHGLENDEVIFSSNVSVPVSLSSSRINVDTLLLKAYDENDLRKKAYFTVNAGRTIFKGSYAGSNSLIFTGITSAELLLIRAECNARLNNLAQAAKDLEELLKNRYANTVQIPHIPDNSKGELLKFVLLERRKELVFRGRRWQDLRRFAQELALSVTPRRKIENVIYELKPGDLKWVWPIPPDVIQISGFEQNPR